MARRAIACRIVGAAVGSDGEEALPPGVLCRLVRMIEANLGARITVRGSAREAGLSRSHFSHALQAATGEAPQEFVLGRRLCRARDLLAEADQSIAAETGFASHAHFSTDLENALASAPPSIVGLST